jgi:indolepyruvate ferredoxin oxidoreductase beta subunit
MRDSGHRVVSFDAMTIARDLGEIRLGNTVMLGAIADYLPFASDVLLACIDKRFARKGEKVVEANRQAFAAGREAVAKQLATTPA